MPRSSVRVVFNRFGDIAEALQPRAEAIVAKVAHDVEAIAKSLAPVDTGALENSIRAMRLAQGHWVIAPTVDYGIYLELGTRHMPAQPYLFPALERVRAAFTAALEGLFGGR